MPERRVEDVLWAYRDRMLDLKKDRRFRYILIFKNHGEAAGASLEHTHSQLIALPIVPKRVREEVDGAKAVLQLQGALHLLRHHPPGDWKPAVRVIAENAGLHRPGPLAPRFRSRRGSCPRPTSRAFEESQKHEFEQLAAMLKDMLMRLDAVLDRPAYNYIIHTSPFPESVQRLLPLAPGDHAEADQGGGLRVGHRLLHQSHAAGGGGEVPARGSRAGHA